MPDDLADQIANALPGWVTPSQAAAALAELDGPPPIPATCEHRPTAGGYVLPWLNVQLADGGVDFRRQHTTRLAQCLYNGWCQLCARPMRSPMVLFGTQRVFEHLFFNEPALHPECGLYALRACPMLRGDRTEYARGPSVAQGPRGKVCFKPGCECGGWVNHGDPQRTDYAAKPWFMVWARDYAMSVDEQGGPTGAVLTPGQVLKIMLVSQPGVGRCWERIPKEVALANYTPPNAIVHRP